MDEKSAGDVEAMQQDSQGGQEESGSELEGGDDDGDDGLDVELIDDMEDADDRIVETNGRSGRWYTSNLHGATAIFPDPDEKFTMTRLDDPRGDSRWAVHVYARDYALDGVYFGFDLRSEASWVETYDLSAYIGFSFWARKGERHGSSLKIGLADFNTDPRGGACRSTDDC